MLRALTLLAIYIALGLPAAIIGIPWALVTGNIEPAYQWGMAIARIGLRIVGIQVEAEWQAPLDPAKKYLFYSNHLSNLDPPVLIPLLPGRTSIFIKRSLLRIPILGYGMKLAGFIPVTREGTVEAAKQSVDTAAREMSRGVHITSFVEGTRSPDGRLLPFKKGPFYLAMETCAPVVPITIRGTEKLMPKGSLRVRPGTVRVLFHPPLDPAKYSTREELMEAVRESIGSGLRNNAE
ncbi:MAG: lysophospholipid acyltransferase family protein [Acidobacteriaceae bacterium]